MKKWFLLFLLASPTVARAELVTPQFTQGSMQSTTTTTQEITEEIVTTVYGSKLNKWSGDNITPSAAVDASGTSFSVHTAGSDFSLEIIERAADSVVEKIEIDRTIETSATTTSLSVFSQ